MGKVIEVNKFVCLETKLNGLDVNVILEGDYLYTKKEIIEMFQKKLVSYYGDDNVTCNEYDFGQILIDGIKKVLK